MAHTLHFIAWAALLGAAGADAAVLKKADALDLISNRFMPKSPQPGYCTGYHCYHHSLSLCESYGSQDCAGLVVRRRAGKVTSPYGHAMNVIRQPLGDGRALYCMVDPQIRKRPSAKQCWTASVSGTVTTDPWVPPRESRDALCLALEERNPVCDGAGKLPTNIDILTVPAKDLLDGSPYLPWWENPGLSAGQLMGLCEIRNGEQRALREKAPGGSDPVDVTAVSWQMPTCEDRRATGAELCATGEESFACRLSKPAACGVFQCQASGQGEVVGWSKLRLPECGESAGYCKAWIAKVNGSKQFDHLKSERFAERNTVHYCREKAPSALLRTFRCVGTASAAGFRLLSEDEADRWPTPHGAE